MGSGSSAKSKYTGAKDDEGAGDSPDGTSSTGPKGALALTDGNRREKGVGRVRISKKEPTVETIDPSQDHEHHRPVHHQLPAKSLKANHVASSQTGPTRLCPYVTEAYIQDHPEVLEHPGQSPRPDGSPQPAGSPQEPGSPASPGPAAGGPQDHRIIDPHSLQDLTNIDDFLREVERLFPVDDFEMTLYATLPRFRPGEHITMQDFKEKKTLNGMGGTCEGYDGRVHVWTIQWDNGKKARVVPKSLQKALQDPNISKAGKSCEGFVAYGCEIIHVVLDTEHVSLHRHIKEHHMPRPKTPPKKKKHKKHDAEQHQENDDEDKRKTKKERRKKKKGEESLEESEDEVKQFEVDDMVVMKDAGGARLGVGRVKELGEMKDDHRMLKVEFGQRGGIYNLEDTELEHAGDKKKRASKFV